MKFMENKTSLTYSIGQKQKLRRIFQLNVDKLLNMYFATKKRKMKLDLEAYKNIQLVQMDY